jgi:hypothetical protein
MKKPCPALFQELIDARLDIRVTAIGDTLYAAEIDSKSGASPLDWRFDYTVPFREHTLNLETSARLIALMRCLNLVYAAMDLCLTPDGVNPNGHYLFISYWR